MTTVGYGDYFPHLLIGRIIGVFACIFGIITLSLFVVSINIVFDLDDDQNCVYEDIQKVELRNQVYEDYMKKYCEYLVMKKQKRSSPIELLILKQKLTVLRNSKVQKIRMLEKKANSLYKFNKIMDEMCDTIDFTTVVNLGSNINTLKKIASEIGEKSERSSFKVKKSKNFGFKMLNLANFIATTGHVIRFESADEILHRKMLRQKEIQLRIREYYYKYGVKGISPMKRKQSKRVSRFVTDLSVLNVIDETSSQISSSSDDSDSDWKPIHKFK